MRTLLKFFVISFFFSIAAVSSFQSNTFLSTATNHHQYNHHHHHMIIKASQTRTRLLLSASAERETASPAEDALFLDRNQQPILKGSNSTRTRSSQNLSYDGNTNTTTKSEHSSTLSLLDQIIRIYSIFIWMYWDVV